MVLGLLARTWARRFGYAAPRGLQRKLAKLICSIQHFERDNGNFGLTARD